MGRKRKKPVGNRSARRGHWTPGKPRNKPAEALIREINDVLRKHHTHRPPEGQPRISTNAIAEDLGVDSRTVRRWLSGEDNPAADHKRRLQAWLRRVKRQLPTH